MSELPIVNTPRVIIANIGNLGVEQSYPNIVIEQADVNTAQADFFNKIYDKYPIKKEEKNKQAYIFLPEQFECIKEHTIQKMIDKLSYNDNFTGIYSDIYMCGKTKNITYVPAYDKKIIDQNIVINIPIMFSNSCRPVFHDKIKYLCFYQVLVTVGQRFVFSHIAEPLFNVTYKTQPHPKDIKSDMEIISSLRGSV